MGIAVAGGIAATLFVYNRGQYNIDTPLEGVLHFDFGEVVFDGRILELRHQFELANTSGAPLEIMRTVSTCGCTVADVSKDVIHPSERVAITVTLVLKDAIRRRETVWLVLEGGAALPLTVTATARRNLTVYTANRNIILSKQSPAKAVLVALDYSSNIPPSPPTFSTPNGVTASFLGWEPIFSHDSELGRPARWQSLIEVVTDRSELPPGASMHVAIGNERQLEIALYNVDP